ncbi:hypothetical protein HMPREF9420_1659 [Segatella salivae DSM 15606]|uniref:Uncharacterized protein n=1 Tax=Segatella salivae DSM 15606 TaxID=888832 RepID=E6MQ91_9BACT|nr:hypothetical protein HMPREF9420_1659 [Segatella salivae DSM 15606]
MIIPFTLFHSIKNGKSHDDLHQTILLFIINNITTPNCFSNYLLLFQN